jgi:ribonuclease BN (tRNA processing enzyme)
LLIDRQLTPKLANLPLTDVTANTGEKKDMLIFLGTAGARVMVAHQILASGGLWLDLNGTQILFDPGPGCLVQATKRKLNPTKLQAIILSHRHLDHSADMNVMIEAMTDGGLHKRGVIFLPSDALDDDPVILRYLQGYPERIEILKEGGRYSVGDVSFATPLRHQHAVETYGVVFETHKHSISCIVDSRYFDGLCTAYKSDLLIINVVRLEPSGTYDHLSALDAGRIIREIRPKAAIITHFGMTMWRAKPWEVAKNLSQETGVNVVAARDGMRFDLAQLSQY